MFASFNLVLNPQGSIVLLPSISTFKYQVAKTGLVVCSGKVILTCNPVALKYRARRAGLVNPLVCPQSWKLVSCILSRDSSGFDFCEAKTNI